MLEVNSLKVFISIVVVSFFEKVAILKAA